MNGMPTAFQMRQCLLQDRRASVADLPVVGIKLSFQRITLGQICLVRRQYVDREMGRPCKRRIAIGVSPDGPQDEWRLQGNRRKGIDRHRDISSGKARSHKRHARGVARQCITKFTRVDQKNLRITD